MGQEVRVEFADGTSAVGDAVLGCDGIHSAVRSLLVEPDRQPYYSGIANAYGFVKSEHVHRGGADTPFFNDSALIMSRYGSTLTTFCDYDRSLIYVVLLIQMAEAKSRGGWKSAAEDQEAIRNEGLRRTSSSAIPGLENMMAQVDEWTLYPVYLLPPNGVWHTNRVLLLGDAAHAVRSP
jgi:2-polyprenyl-6-methoxyphenol hydroxylase-like FAD-dependent oxidoreductase